MSETAERVDEVKALCEVIKSDILDVITKHAAACSKLAIHSADPHTPVISTVQLAFAQAAVNYLIVCGLDVNTAVNATLQVTGQAMEHWARALLKHSEAVTQSQKRTVLHVPDVPVNRKQ